MIGWFEKHTGLSWSVTIGIAAGIFYISSLPSSSIPGAGISFNPKLYHIIIFFLLTFFLSIALVKGKYKKYLAVALFLAFFYATLDEIHQSFVPGRTPSFRDLFLDALGILTATSLYFVSLEYRKKYT